MKLLKNMLMTTATALMILSGIQLIIANSGDNLKWYWLLAGDLLLIAGLDIRYYQVRIRIKQQIIHSTKEGFNLALRKDKSHGKMEIK